MKLNIEILTEKYEEDYTNWLLSVDNSLLYASLPYRNFLKLVLDNSRPLYLLAFEQDRIVGALPAFLKLNTQIGNVLNSMPFYGSNGGPIVSSQVAQKAIIQKALLDAFLSLAHENQVISSTIISNPLDPLVKFYYSDSQAVLRDERIGQITSLPNNPGSSEMIEEALMGRFHKKTRNAIRKAQGSRVVVRHTDSLEALQTLSMLHQKSMTAIGGSVKPWPVFVALRETFVYDRDYRVYLAEKDGGIIAALLVFFYNRVAEYYIPATDEGARLYQPMSLLVYEAMQEAIRRGCLYWNWGGTWLSMSGVYNFKSRWGTTDYPYFYYVHVMDESILLKSKQVLLKEYPYFYIVPFVSLKT
jgi:hypothetical protein